MQKTTTWGRWQLDKTNWTLVHRDEHERPYEIDLEKMTDADEVLDWICHINENERTMTPEDVGNFIRALSEIFHHLPSTFKDGAQPNVTALLEEKYGAT